MQKRRDEEVAERRNVDCAETTYNRTVSSLVRSVLVLLTIPALGCTMMGPPVETGFLEREIEIGGQRHRYAVWVSTDYDPSVTTPTILFLHGAGERGEDGWSQAEVGLGRAIRENDLELSAIVVFPQLPLDQHWIGQGEDLALGALEQTIDEFNVDQSRVYLTGLSLGGYGTWHLALAHPDRFAAIVPVCGGLVQPETSQNVRTSPLVEGRSNPWEFAASKLSRLPVWIFHGADDGVLPVSESRKMEDALSVLGSPVRYTEYPGVGHNAWDRAYADREMWQWLFSQSRHE